jgi:siroheme synthase
VISKGTLPDERTFVGTAKTISGIVAENNVQAPAIIIIGDVVELSSKVHEFVSAVNYN